MDPHILTGDRALTFILAGKATFTIRNTITGKRYTYKVTAPDQENQSLRFVKVLVGSDNENNYAYVYVQ
jgi:hypothetical protein